MDKLLLIEILLPRSLAGTRVASAGAGDPVAIFSPYAPPLQGRCSAFRGDFVCFSIGLRCVTRKPGQRARPSRELLLRAGPCQGIMREECC